MHRCCRNIAARRPSNGRWQTGKARPASPRCGSMKGSTPATCCCRSVWRFRRSRLRWSCRRYWLTVGAGLMVRTLAGLAEGTLQATPQDNSAATLAPMLRREDGRIEWSRTAVEIYNRWRGFQPWPGAFTSFRGKKLSVHSMRVAESHFSAGAAGNFDAQCEPIVRGVRRRDLAGTCWSCRLKESDECRRRRF